MSGDASQPAEAEKMFFLFGSETGNAESIAKRLHHSAVNTHGFPDAQCMNLNQFVTKKVLEAHLVEDVGTSLCLVIVCSTTGEGEPPLNAARFRRWLRNTAGTLHKVRYCVLALGDTNYNSFCAPGIFMDNKLHEMGAVRCYPRGEADDGVGLELVVDPWVENVWSALKKSTSDASGSGEGIGHEKYQANEGRIDMAVAQEAAILFSNASHLCSVAALFLYERIMELGGKADLYPLQYFHPPTSLTRPPKVLLFILAEEADESTLCEHCACQPRQLPPLGPFSAWLSGADVASVPAEAAELQAWMSDPSIRFFNSLFVAPSAKSLACVEKLDANFKAAAAACKLEPLCRRQLTGEVPSVARTDDDVFFWTAGVLDSLPGVTATTEAIHRTMEYSFGNRVGAAFEAEVATHVEADTAGRGAGRGTSSEHGTATSGTGASRSRRRYGLQKQGDERASMADTSMTSHPPQQERAADGTVRRTHQVLDDLLTPVVFLYSDKSAYVKQCALDIFGAAAQHHLRSSVCELSNFRQTGFPRRATFVFIVSGTLTKSMVRVLKVLRTLQAQGKQVDGVNFAILGIDKSSESDRFNACALELETLLLEMKATKIHCTGLADMDCGGLLPVIQSWEANLWSAIVHPMKSAAYLDMASSTIHVPHTFSPLAGSQLLTTGSSPLVLQSANTTALTAAAAASGGAGAGVTGLAGTITQTAATALPGERRTSLPSQQNGRGSGRDSLAAPEMAFARTTTVGVGADIMATAAQMASPAGASLDGAALLLSRVPGVSSPVGDGHGLPFPAASPMMSGGFGGSPFPWDAVPLHKSNAQRTPVAFLYASAGMSKTMAVNAMQSAEEKGFPAVLHSFANYHLVDLRACPNLILFCEAGPDGQSNGGRRFKKFLTNPLHRPDDLSFVRFAVLGLGPTPSTVVHPAFLWAKLLSRLQANRVFPVVIMPSLSQLHSLGIPWADCVLSSMALLPTAVQPADTPVGSTTQPAPPTSTTAAAVAAVGTTSAADASVFAGGQHSSSAPNGGSAAHDSERDAASAAVDPHVAAQRCILFLFGSSTGITESIARDLHREAIERGFYSRVAALKYFQKMNFLSTPNVVLVCSTIPTAPGGFPRNARSFARYVLAPDQPPTLLSGTSFAVLGVGNGSATSQGPESYCRTAVRFDRRMGELGGHRLCSVGTIDASLSIAQPVEAWRREMFAALEARAAALTVQRRALDEARQHELPLPAVGAEHGAGGGATAPSEGSAAAVADRSQPRPQRAAVAYCCAPTSVVEELTEYLARVIDETTPMVPTVCTLNELLKRNWRSEFDMLIVVVGQNSEAEFPINGSAFARVLRQRTAPLDMFASVSYTVLAVSDSNSTQFYMGRQLDRRLEELGGTRVYARGEVVDSFRLERTVERWVAGLTQLLTSMCENAAKGSETDMNDDMDEHTAGRGRGAAGSTASSSEMTAGRILRHLHRSDDAAVLPQLQGQARSRWPTVAVPETDTTTGWNAAAGTVHAHEGGDADAALGTLGGGGDAPSLHDWRTESSMVNRIAYSPDNAGDRVDGVLQSWKLLTSAEAERPVLQVNLSVSAETQWAPGQTVAILPSNNATEVEALLQLFKVAHQEPFHPLSIAGAASSCYPTSPLYDAVDFPVSCGMILLRYVDLRLTRSHKVIFQLLEENAPTEADRAAVRAYVAALATDRTPRTLLEVLEAFPRCVPPFRHVVENATLMQPRQYSICSSHQADPTTLSICFKFVEKGLCTGWMCEQCLWASKLPTTAISHVFASKSHGDKKTVASGGGSRGGSDGSSGEPVAPNVLVQAKRRVLIPFVIRRASEFRMPRDPLIPMVLIGPGTGIAPFRAFLQEREAWLTRRQEQCGSTCPKGQLCGCPYTEATPSSPAICGSIDLFHGCHGRTIDFLYGEELQTWETEGVLHSMTVAFSREPNEGGFWYGGCYVQDRLQECAVALMDLIVQRNAYVFVCGDADGMAKEVHAVLLELIQQHLSLTEATAAEYLEQMSKDGRYLRDVWSTSF